eukprot:gb/GEZN01020866.1/.p1 GENE.gb/GEZN01020866.1/~~gb/GEZN01020866.1/.p1  ORF type:complete len:111 (-),score=13.12 gb/GEZN01020866.1/:339-671(-)
MPFGFRVPYETWKLRNNLAQRFQFVLHTSLPQDVRIRFKSDAQGQVRPLFVAPEHLQVPHLLLRTVNYEEGDQELSLLRIIFDRDAHRHHQSLIAEILAGQQSGQQWVYG